MQLPPESSARCCVSTASPAWARQALSTLGPAAVPALLEALKDKTSPTVLHHAVLALGNIGPQAKAAVPILADELKRKNWAGLYSAATCIIALILFALNRLARPRYAWTIAAMQLEISFEKAMDILKKDGN